MTLLRMLCCVMILSVSAFAGTYSGGDGSESQPYEIANVADYLEFCGTQADWASYFVLTADIDLTGVTVNPIGNYNVTKFTGYFDGQGFNISNVQISSTSNFIGVFGDILNAYIGNVNVVSANMTGQSHVGALVGRVTDSIIFNCSSSGSVTASYSDVGGLVGSHNGQIHDCSSSANVFTGAYAGGLVGTNDGLIENSFASGLVNAGGSVGGLIGRSGNDGVARFCFSTGTVISSSSQAGGFIGLNSSLIENCYSKGAVTITGSNKKYLGGFVGWNYPSSSSIIRKCYSTGLISSVYSVTYVGGFCARNQGSISASFWDKETSGSTASSGGTPLTTAEMQDEATFTSASWDMTYVWGIAVDDYPSLRDFAISDMNKDSEVNLIDWADFATLLETSDLNKDGAVDMKDVMFFCGQWLME